MKATQILCPVDFSEHSEFALNYATQLAKESGAVLHLVHVHEDALPYDTGFGGYIPAPTDMGAVEAELKRVKPSAPDVSYQHAILVGDPATALVDYASEHKCDLIVLGTHGRTGLARLLMGSVAEAVVRRADCPVISVKQPAKVAQTT